jgi:alkylation response protein AidB-like acyl-CoA dehydrogenase
MRFEFTEDQIKWRDEIRSFLIQNITPDLRQEMREVPEPEEGPLTKVFQKKVAEKGWNKVSWPVEYGGMGGTTFKQFILAEEFRYAHAPWLGMTMSSLGPTILNVASEEMKKEWIPKIVSGEVTFALGYSEPDAGSDLANLKTEAVIDGDEFVINGQKTWNSEGHVATHEFLACRTDPNVAKHKGISIILVPIDYPGVTISPIETWGTMTTNDAFFDNVRVPRSNLVGNLNEGWLYAMIALNLERLDIGSVAEMRSFLDEVIIFLKEKTIDGETLSKNTLIRQQIAELYTELEACKWLNYASAVMIDENKYPLKEMLMSKIWTTEIRTRFSYFATQALDLYGQLNQFSKWVPLNGDVDRFYRLHPVHRFGAGTNDVLRDVIAQKGLKLPRG